jgi:putative transposase
LREHGLQIAPSTYRAAKRRSPSARTQRDAVVLERIRAVHSDREIGRGLYGVRKVHAQLRREGGVAGRPVSRRQVERLMRTDGLAGVRRGRTFRTTRPDSAATRPPDLVQRNFTAPAPNRLWLVDFTYVPTWSGMAFTAFVHDAWQQRGSSPTRRAPQPSTAAISKRGPRGAVTSVCIRSPPNVTTSTPGSVT